jgi:hypothetical protein
MRVKLAASAVAGALALAFNAAPAIGASSGVNSGEPPGAGNCFGNFVAGGSMGFNASNFGPPSSPPGPSGLGQVIGKDEHGCRD